MVDTSQLTLFTFVLIRMTGFISFSPLWGRKNVPGMVKAGVSMMLAVAVYSMTTGITVAVPQTMVEYAVRIVMELALGYLLGVVMNFFFYIVLQAGQLVDTQMGMNMAETYDAAMGTNVSLTGTLLNIMMVLLFFAARGHLTLMRMLLTSGELVPYGAVSIGPDAAANVLRIFSTCVTLALQLSLPILAAELIGQLGMGILMKVIPQINVFAINFELKILLGFILVMIMLPAMSEFIMTLEQQMLATMQQVLESLA